MGARAAQSLVARRKTIRCCAPTYQAEESRESLNWEAVRDAIRIVAGYVGDGFLRRGKYSVVFLEGSKKEVFPSRSLCWDWNSLVSQTWRRLKELEIASQAADYTLSELLPSGLRARSGLVRDNVYVFISDRDVVEAESSLQTQFQVLKRNWITITARKRTSPTVRTDLPHL